MQQKPKNLIALFVICLVLIPSLIYGGTVTTSKGQLAAANTQVLKRIEASPKAIKLPIGSNEQALKNKLEVKAYYKGEAQPRLVKDYTTDFDTINSQKGTHTVTIKYTENGYTKTSKVCVTFCKEVTDKKPQPSINFPYISGYPDGTFRPNQQVIRAELATMIARLLTQNDIPAQENQFTDVPELKFSTDAINYVTKLGLMKPYEDGTFRPNNSVTLKEAQEIMSRLARYLKTDEVSVPAGDGDLTRTQAVVLLNKLFNITCGVSNKTSGFSDVTPSTPYYQDIICATQKRATPR